MSIKFYHSDSDSDYEVEVKSGEGAITQSTRDLHTHCFQIKGAMATLSFCYGQEKSAVNSIRNHNDFNAGSVDGCQEIVRSCKKRERFFNRDILNIQNWYCQAQLQLQLSWKLK